MQVDIDFRSACKSLKNTWNSAITPDPDMKVSEWAEKHRHLSTKSSAEGGGKWKNSRTPYLQEVMDALSVSSPVQRIVVKKGAQVGFTEAGNNFIGYVIHLAPGPFLSVAPTESLARKNSRQKIEPLISESPALRKLVASSRKRDAGNTILSKEFPGGVLVMTSAGSAVGLRSMVARYIFLDEVDGYEVDVSGEGDPILLAERRTATYGKRRKIFIVSTPTTKGTSRISREFEISDKRYYFINCPLCQHKQTIKFENMVWTKGNPKDIFLRCEGCEEAIHEHHKTEMLAGGEWIPTAEGDGITRGYHLSSLYSPTGWFTWEEAARIYELAQEYPELMKGFVNTVLGEAYEDEYDAPEWERLYERREKYEIGVIPHGGLFLTAGVDIQKNRIECEVVAWGRDKISWSVDYFVLDGNTAEKAVWTRLKKVLEKDYPHACGATLPIRVMCVDSGYATQDVYNWVKDFPQAVWGGAGARASQPRTVVAIKGRDTETALISSVSKADLGGKRKGLRVWNLGVPLAKAELYRWLKLPRPTDEDLEKGETFPAGTCHFPEYGEEFFKQITAEKRVIRMHKGFPKASWEKDPTQNNEALDCRGYARAGASIFGLDRFKDIHWRRMENSLCEISVIDSSPNNDEESKTPSFSELFNAPNSNRDNDPYL